VKFLFSQKEELDIAFKKFAECSALNPNEGDEQNLDNIKNMLGLGGKIQDI